MAKQSDQKKYEHLGRMLVNIFESGYINANQTYKQSFLKGLVGGFGGVIGATVVVALLIWLLTVFKHVPLIGPFVDSFRTTVQEKR